MRHIHRTRAFVATVLLAAGSIAAKGPFSVDSDESTKKTAGALAHDLLQYYHGNETGEIPGILGNQPPAGDHWWYEGAVMWATLIDYTHVTGDKTYNDLITQGMLWQTGEGQDFMPKNYTAALSNDDQGLWAMAAMLAVERGFPDPPSDKPQWLNLAQNVFDIMTMRYDATCGGGLRWQVPSFNNGFDYKNSFSNGVFFNLGARLARYTGNKTYAEWADKTWDWMEQVALIDPETYTVYDGANVNGGCKSVNKAQFSWPSGVFALGAAHMYNYTDAASKWQNRLDKLIDHGLKAFFPGEVATETACEKQGKCTTDMKMWKGVVHQWYAAAAQLAPFLTVKLVPAIKASAKLAAQQCTGGNSGQDCGFSWTNGTFDGDTGAEQEMSVLAAVSSLLVQRSDAPRTAKSSRGSSSDGNGNVDNDVGKDRNSTGGNNGTSSRDKTGGSATAVLTGVHTALLIALALTIASMQSRIM